MVKKLRFSWLVAGALVLIFFFLGREIWPERELYFQKYDPDYWGERYENSQWAKGFEATELMGDADLYAYAGWRQIQGDDPTAINQEQPPVGKYLLGSSILFFGNPLWVSLILAIGCLGLVYLIGFQVTGSKTWSLVPVVLLASDRVFSENLVTYMLDLPILFFTLAFFTSFINCRLKKKNYIWPMIWLALLSGTKMYLLGFGLLAVTSLLVVYWAVVEKDDSWKRFFVFLPFFGLVYLIIYGAYFIHGHGLMDFKYHHFWVRHFARVRVTGYPLGQIWRLFLTGKWLIWWPSDTAFRLIDYEKWTFLWPVSLVFAVSGFISWLKKSEPVLLILLVWTASFLAMHSLGVPYPRYLLPFLPALYLLMTRQLQVWLKRKK